MSADGWVDKENVVYTYSRVLFDLKYRRGNPTMCHDVDKPGEQ